MPWPPGEGHDLPTLTVRLAAGGLLEVRSSAPPGAGPWYLKVVSLRGTPLREVPWPAQGQTRARLPMPVGLAAAVVELWREGAATPALWQVAVAPPRMSPWGPGSDPAYPPAR